MTAEDLARLARLVCWYGAASNGIGAAIAIAIGDRPIFLIGAGLAVGSGLAATFLGDRIGAQQ